MADYTCIYYVTDGKPWAEYLKDTLASKEYDISVILRDFREWHTLSPAKAHSKLDILLISPGLLEAEGLDFKNEFDSTPTVVVLTGVDNDDWNFVKQALRMDSKLDWFIHELESKEGSVRDLIMLIVSLYERAVTQSPNPSLSERESASSGAEDDAIKGTNEAGIKKTVKTTDLQDKEDKGRAESIYDPLPPTRPLNRITNVFRKDDYVYLILEGLNNGCVKVRFPETGRELMASLESDIATLYSFQHRNIEDTFEVLLNGKEIGYGKIERQPRSVSQYFGPGVSRDSAASSSSGISSSLSEMSAESVCERPPQPHSISWKDPMSVTSSKPSSLFDKLHQLLEDVTDPVHILCQSLDVEANLAHLDDKLTQMTMSKDALNTISFQPQNVSVSEAKDSVWPTLLHFGAHYGLQKLCLSIVNNPLTQPAAIVRNKNMCCPHDIARQKGHIQLAATLKLVFEDMLSKKEHRDSGYLQRSSTFSSRTNTHGNPPPLYPRPRISKSASSDDESMLKGILKRSSQSSLKSNDYESIDDLGLLEIGADTSSISSADSSHVTFDPSNLSEEEKTPAPSTYESFPALAHGSSEGQHIRTSNRASNPIQIPGRGGEDDEIAETHKNDIDKYFGRSQFQLSSSVPSESHIHRAKEEKSHGFFGIFKGKKTQSKSAFYTTDGDGSDPSHRQPHSGKKAKVYTHRRGHNEENDSSPDEEEQDRFRSRLPTYPLSNQILRKPNVKKLKEKHAAAVKELASSTSGTTDDSYLPDAVFRREPHSSKDKKAEKSHHKKQSHSDKENQKSRIQLVIAGASKRMLKRLHIAQNDEHTMAPALPPKQSQMKNPGKY